MAGATGGCGTAGPGGSGCGAGVHPEQDVPAAGATPGFRPGSGRGVHHHAVSDRQGLHGRVQDAQLRRLQRAQGKQVQCLSQDICCYIFIFQIPKIEVQSVSCSV